MPRRTSPTLGALALVTVALVGGCVSTPCVGDSCPDACNGVDCDQPATENGATTSGSLPTCDSNASCDETRGFECVDGACRHPCRSHFDCGGVARCEPLGRNGTYCAVTEPPTTPGGYYSHCADGLCDDRLGFICVGAGVGDTESYCTTDCEGDADCPNGYFCDAVRSAGGGERKLCTPRGFCSECESDADCLSVPGGVCARDESGARTCTQLCDPARNSCPWGTATECRTVDSELGVPTCQHRFGACRASGNGCEPCERDDDCPNGYCLVSTYSGERWCIDQSTPCSCAGLTSF
ncbi:MAG TPA: hypothetical protein VF103_09025, partial [Polyangiaceae bacterium]